MKMLRPILSILLFTFVCCASPAEGIDRRLSPELTKLLADHPAALKILSNSFSESFSNRSVGIFYFYSHEDSEPRAYHFYNRTLGGPEVFICVRENQHPLDQFALVLFEILNSQGETRFKKLADDARVGAVSKQEFARGALKAEFEALRKTRELLLSVNFDKKEIDDSSSYSSFADCPEDFEKFLAYSKSLSVGRRDIFQEYEKQYDGLRKR